MQPGWAILQCKAQAGNLLHLRASITLGIAAASMAWPDSSPVLTLAC